MINPLDISVIFHQQTDIMGQFKDSGNPFLALAEECAEVIQVISKKFRFDGSWDEIPEGKDISRLQQLQNEMNDLIYQWNRCCAEVNLQQKEFVAIAETQQWECNEGTLHLYNEICNCPTEADFWDGDDSQEGS